MCMRTPPHPPLTYACASRAKRRQKHSYRYEVRTHVPLSVEPKAPGFGRGMGANEPGNCLGNCGIGVGIGPRSRSGFGQTNCVNPYFYGLLEFLHSKSVKQRINIRTEAKQ